MALILSPSRVLMDNLWGGTCFGDNFYVLARDDNNNQRTSVHVLEVRPRDKAPLEKSQ